MAPSDENENCYTFLDSSCFQGSPYLVILAMLPKLCSFFSTPLSLSLSLSLLETQKIISSWIQKMMVFLGSIQAMWHTAWLTYHWPGWSWPSEHHCIPNEVETLHKDSLFPSLSPLLWGQRRDLYLKLEKEVHQWGNYHLNDGAKQQYSTTASSHAQDILQISSRLFFFLQTLSRVCYRTISRSVPSCLYLLSL